MQFPLRRFELSVVGLVEAYTGEQARLTQAQSPIIIIFIQTISTMEKDV